MIDPGQMRTRLVYQEPTNVEDGAGSSTTEWADVFVLWARVRPAKSDERVQGGPQVQGRVDYEITCRYDARIEPTGRFLIEGTSRVLNIAAVVDWELRRVELTIRAHEIL
jgi:SPP1 family predicted phage head-tail adaptor